MLIEVLNEVASDTGYHPVQQRAALIKLLNQGAKLLYDKLECNHIYREVTLVVPRNKVVSLCSFIGELRGMRAHTTDYPFDLQSMGSPRYVNTTMGYKMKNWRDLGISAVHTLPSNTGILTFEFVTVDGVTITVSGETAYAAKIAEEIDLTVSGTVSTNMFTTKIFSISCLEDRTCNITIKDVDGNEIAILYNTDKETAYKLVDVSEMFWSTDTVADETLVDVLYKVILNKLEKDTDKFPTASNYDEAWYHMCMHKFYSPMENRIQDASNEMALAMAAAVSAKGGSELGENKRVSFGRSKYYNLQRGEREYWPGAAPSNVGN